MAWNDFLQGDWSILTPELVVLLFALLAPIVALYDRDRRAMQQFTLIGLGGAFLMAFGSVIGFNFRIPGTPIVFNTDWVGSSLGDVYHVSEASQVLKLVFLGSAFLAVLGTGRILKGKTEEDYGEYHGLLLFATLGMMVVASARELILLFIGIETASMASYLLAAFRRDQVGAEASLKYFAVGAVSSSMTVFGISLLYAVAGTTRLHELGDSVFTTGGFDGVTALASVLLLAGLGFKVSSVPFHAWAPDVYSGAPAPVVGFLASASKAMGFAALFLVFLVGLGEARASWQFAVAVIAVASMLVGNLIALQQTSIRRMLAYSSIAQAGYVLIALVVGSTYAVGGGILHLLVNAAMKLGAFLVVGSLMLLGIQDHVDGWKGLGRRAPWLAFAMTLFLLSMAGIPPLGGFASKFVLFGSAVRASTAGEGWMLLLALAAVIGSALSLFYYLRIIRAMYVEGKGDAYEPGHHAPGAPEAVDRLRIGTGAMAAILACAVLVVVVGVWPEPFVAASMEAARTLLATP
ncbi:MAG TPA: NADH-quinone oxidoreductase subunit N [Candidatus Thermoplasmatota archaeon]|nr:NADH-quinone oxidoreductase subunit N [Candidatus Thermoplasmatota archaeon]